jgi:hypothetical protein
VDTSNKVGDKVIYCEIDSILPPAPEFEFLRKRCWSDKYRGHVIKGMKMAGLVSYDLVLPVTKGYEDKPDGFDMTDILGVRKREDEAPDVPAAASRFERFIDYLCRKLGIKRRAKKSVSITDGWLSFAHKTDETRIENLSYLFNNELIKGTPVYTTVKCDGQSATFAVYKKHFFIASRNVVLYCEPIRRAIKEFNPKKEHSKMDNFRKIAARYNLPNLDMLEAPEGRNVVIQGELCGPGIQKNPMGLADIDLFVFNVYYPQDNGGEGVFLSWDGIAGFCKTMKLKTVPFIEKRLFDWPDKAALKEYAKGKYPNGKDREGVVIRYDSGSGPMPKALRGMSNMWSFKCINDDYILGGK